MDNKEAVGLLRQVHKHLSEEAFEHGSQHLGSCAKAVYYAVEHFEGIEKTLADSQSTDSHSYSAEDKEDEPS